MRWKGLLDNNYLIARNVDIKAFRAFFYLHFNSWLRFWLRLELFAHKFCKSVTCFLNRLWCDMSIDIHGSFNIFVT